MQPAGHPPEVRLLPVGVPHHRRLAALREATAHPASDLFQPRGLWVAIQVVVAVIGERPDARLVVVPEDPRRGGARVEREATGGARRTSVASASANSRGESPPAPAGYHLGQTFPPWRSAAQRMWPGEGCGAREAGSPQVALDVDAGLDSGGGWPCLDDDLAAIR